MQNNCCIDYYTANLWDQNTEDSEVACPSLCLFFLLVLPKGISCYDGPCVCVSEHWREQTQDYQAFQAVNTFQMQRVWILHSSATEVAFRVTSHTLTHMSGSIFSLFAKCLFLKINSSDSKACPQHWEYQRLLPATQERGATQKHSCWSLRGITPK